MIRGEDTVGGGSGNQRTQHTTEFSSQMKSRNVSSGISSMPSSFRMSGKIDDNLPSHNRSRKDRNSRSINKRPVQLPAYSSAAPLIDDYSSSGDDTSKSRNKKLNSKKNLILPSEQSSLDGSKDSNHHINNKDSNSQDSNGKHSNSQDDSNGKHTKATRRRSAAISSTFGSDIIDCDDKSGLLTIFSNSTEEKSGISSLDTRLRKLSCTSVLSGMNVLVVDDSVAILKMMSNVLKQEKAVVTQAKNGLEVGNTYFILVLKMVATVAN